MFLARVEPSGGSARMSLADIDRSVAGSRMTVPSRSDCEDLLFHEAALLDEWRLEEWLDLFVEGATYEVPTTGRPETARSADELFYIADDWFRLNHRVARLMKPGAHSEWPRSLGARVISNVRVLSTDDGGIRVGSVFTTYRSKDDRTDTFFGHHRHVLRDVGGTLKIASKMSLLAMGSLRPHGRISIIL